MEIPGTKEGFSAIEGAKLFGKSRNELREMIISRNTARKRAVEG
jgi:hypothetical protein